MLHPSFLPFIQYCDGVVVASVVYLGSDTFTIIEFFAFLFIAIFQILLSASIRYPSEVAICSISYNPSFKFSVIVPFSSVIKTLQISPSIVSSVPKTFPSSSVGFE